MNISVHYTSAALQQITYILCLCHLSNKRILDWIYWDAITYTN